jgi:hypothetical protein
MERVTGIGGVFFRAKEPVGLAHWYRDQLGVDSGVDGDSVWTQEPGPTVFAPVESDASYYFAGPEQAVMVNFRVRDLDAMVAQLRAAGADVDSGGRRRRRRRRNRGRDRPLRVGGRPGGQPRPALGASHERIVPSAPRPLPGLAEREQPQRALSTRPLAGRCSSRPAGAALLGSSEATLG